MHTHAVLIQLAVSLLGAMPLAAQARVHADPDSARLVTSDIPRFWAVYDRATLADAGDLFQRDYIDAGSPGVRGFVAGRIRSGRYLAGIVASRPHYYAAIRANTLGLDTAAAVKAAIRTSFGKLKQVYPEAVFPDVYFVIGAMNSGGTTSDAGLLIGLEMNARDDSTPTEDLSSWETAVTGRITQVPYIVAHELMHWQQPPESDHPTLLARALREGGADFVAELVSGGTINQVQRAWGDAHEAALWQEFRRDMNGTDYSAWLYNGDNAKDRPADLGYYEGYRIARALYDRMSDKHAALVRILRDTDPGALLRDSGYDGRTVAGATGM
jgi:hypothetical protein